MPQYFKLQVVVEMITALIVYRDCVGSCMIAAW